MKFRYVGTDAQEAELDSVHDFDEDPHDSRWEPADAKRKRRAASDPPSEPAGEAKETSE